MHVDIILIRIYIQIWTLNTMLIMFIGSILFLTGSIDYYYMDENLNLSVLCFNIHVMSRKRYSLMKKLIYRHCHQKYMPLWEKNVIMINIFFAFIYTSDMQDQNRSILLNGLWHAKIRGYLISSSNISRIHFLIFSSNSEAYAS